MSCVIKKTQKEKFSDRCSRSYIPVWCATPPNYWATEKKPVILWVVMEQAWKQFEKLEPENRGAWLYTAARNACLNRLKHLQVEATNLEALREATHMDVATDYREHERLLQQAESIARNLPEPTCTVLRLCYYEHKTYREVAEQLGISPDTVKKHISKALRTLREAMTLKGGNR